MPQGRAEPLPDHLDTDAIVKRIRRRLAAAGDDELELFPASEDLNGVLTYLREHAYVLRREVERAQANLVQVKRRKSSSAQERLDAQERLKRASWAWRDTWGEQQILVRRQRQFLDVEDAFGIEAARWGRRARMGRDSWMSWEDLAEKQGVESGHGARERYRRLRLAIESKWHVRTPRIAREQAAAEAAEEQRVTDAHKRVRRAAQELLEHREAFETDENVGDLGEWWDGLVEDFVEKETAGQSLTKLQKDAMRVHLDVIVKEIRNQAKGAGVPPARDPAALEALNTATNAVAGEHT